MSTELGTLIAGGTQIATTTPPSTALLTAGSTEKILFSDITLMNTGSSTETVTVWILSSTPTATNYHSTYKVLPGKHKPILQGDGLGASESLYAATTTASTVNIHGYGITQT